MQAEAIRTQWDKRDAVVLRAGRYETLAVPSLGANVLKLTYRHPCGENTGYSAHPPCAQVLLDDPYAYGIPVLFPANRIAGREYSYDGVTYRFPQNYPNGVHIHGVVHNRAWHLAELCARDGEAVLCFSFPPRTPRCARIFPLTLCCGWSVC